MYHCNVKEDLKKCHQLDEIPAVDIEFEDLSYFIGNVKAGGKQILKSINGKFYSGELTGILGPSGAGKSSLLNILAGYVHNGVQGNVKINGVLRKMDTFHKLSTFIMQENLVQPYLTVNEEMMITAHLKLGYSIKEKKKQTMVAEILDLLRLGDCHSTEVTKLSGGQKKRLSVALELINNPPIIFLDEPTTGLDMVAIKQCIDVLKTLTDKGRTVVCTIHQPSLTIMQQFHQVYFISNGMCVYNGPVAKLPTFLSSINLACPVTHSPADFIIESVETNPIAIPILVEATNNGKNYVSERDEKVTTTKEDVTLWEKQFSSTSFWTQLYVLLYRMMLQQRRNKIGFWIQLFSHTLIGVSIGSIFFGIGNDASLVSANVKFCIFTELCIIYIYIITPVIQYVPVPFEIEILKQEYYKRWYQSKALYFAVTLRNLPVRLFLILELSLIIYLMTDQPHDVIKFLKFFSIISVGCIISDGIGLGISVVLKSTSGSIFAPAIIAPWFVVVTIGFGYMDQVSPLAKFFMKTSYVHHIFLAMNHALYNDREMLRCPETELFCYYKNPDLILRDLGATNTTYQIQMLILVAFAIFSRLVAYILLRLRLNPERFIIFYNNFLYKTRGPN